MPSRKSLTAILALNYDAVKDLIFLTANPADPDLGSTGLYITLKKNTPSETILRKHLASKGIIQPRERVELDFKHLIESGKVRSKHAKLLRLLAGSGSSAIIMGEPDATAWASAVYLNATRDPKVISIEVKGAPGQKLSELLDDVVLLHPGQVGVGIEDTVTSEWLLRQALRMHPDFIALNLHEGAINEQELSLGGVTGALYRMDLTRYGSMAASKIVKRGGAADSMVYVEADPRGGWRIAGVELLD